MIGKRILTLTTSTGETDVAVILEAPQQAGGYWICRYEIGWPGRTKRFEARGDYALQANYLTLQRIGAELYASKYHTAGQLRWGRAGGGYGFPVPKTIRNMLIGEDKILDG